MRSLARVSPGVPMIWVERLMLVALSALVWLASPGCGERDQAPEVVSLEGTIEDIKTTGKTTGEITVRYYSEKHKEEIAGTAVVNRDTEIMINGTLADIAQLKKGERVRGDVLLERQGEERVYVVRKMYVDRPTSPSSGG